MCRCGGRPTRKGASGEAVTPASQDFLHRKVVVIGDPCCKEPKALYASPTLPTERCAASLGHGSGTLLGDFPD